MAASRDRVWECWTEPDEIAKWLHPYGVRLDSVAFDVRVGGDYKYTMVNEETDEHYPTGGTFFEIEKPQRIVFSWGEPGATVDASAVISVTLRESQAGEGAYEGSGTEIEFHLRGFEGRPGDNFIYDGWAEALNNFERHLKGELHA